MSIDETNWFWHRRTTGIEISDWVSATEKSKKKGLKPVAIASKLSDLFSERQYFLRIGTLCDGDDDDDITSMSLRTKMWYFSSHTYLNYFKDFRIKQMSVKYDIDFDISVKLSEKQRNSSSIYGWKLSIYRDHGLAICDFSTTSWCLFPSGFFCQLFFSFSSLYEHKVSSCSGLCCTWAEKLTAVI